MSAPKAPDWPQLHQAELAALAARRCKVAPSLTPEEANAQGPAPHITRVGLALSGGGVRSATFALGLLRGLARPSSTVVAQAATVDAGTAAAAASAAGPTAPHPSERLTEHGLLGRFDYISSVSGGGYVAAMLGRLIGKAEKLTPPDAASGLQAAGQALLDHDGRVLDWLRRNGRYLSPGGSRDAGMVVVTYLRSLLAIHMEFMVACMLLGMIVLAPHLVQHTTQALSPAWRPWHSPWIPVALSLVICIAPGLIAAYWLTRESHARHDLPWHGRLLPPVQWLACASLLTIAIVAPQEGRVTLHMGEQIDIPSVYAVCFAVLASVLLGQAACWLLLRHFAHQRIGAAFAAARLRNWLTRALYLSGTLAMGLVALGVLDALSWQLMIELISGHNAWWGGVGAGGVGVLLLRSFAQPLQQLAADAEGRTREWIPRLLNLMSLIGMLALVLAWLVLLQWLVFSPGGIEVLSEAPPLLRAALVLLGALAWVCLTSGNAHMPNGTSLHAFYRARLTRAYLAVGNPARLPWQGKGKDRNVRAVVDGDDGLLTHYRPEQQGGPIHLINTCLNETRDSDSKLYNADRKGTLLTVSWRGMEVGPDRVHAHLGDEEAGTVGQWVAISGAAASPGAGAYTSRGLALLLYFLGIRLGHWVPSPIPTPSLRWLSRLGWATFPKPLMLSCEASATFMGEERPWWYLSDGGHFDNTGVYPLIKRELDVIVLCDASSDRNFLFNDLENLIRKARIDFGAEIDFYTRDEAARLFSGVPHAGLTVLSPEDMRDSASRRGVLLARIRYRSRPDPQNPGRSVRPEGTLVLIKPNLHNALDLDVLSYADRNPDFPHESTSDQFFDEAQWESYHRLGEDMGQAFNEAWLARLPGWRSPAHHQQCVSARLHAPEADTQPTADPLWRRSPRAQALKATLGLSASGTLLLSGWQIVDTMNQQHKEARDQARKLYVEVSNALQGHDRDCKTLPDHMVMQAENLMLDVVKSDAVSALDRGGIERMYARMVRSCAATDPVWSRCPTPQATQDRENFCAALQRPPATATAMNYWVAPQTQQDQIDAARRALASWWPQPLQLAGLSPVRQSTSVATPTPETAGGAVPPEATARSEEDKPAVAAPAGKSTSTPAAKPEPTAVPPVPPDALHQACVGNKQPALLYVQIYDEATRAAAEDLRQRLLKRDQRTWTVPPVDNVVQRTALQGLRSPVPWPRPTLVVHRNEDMACATELRNWVQAAMQKSGFQVGDPRLGDEVWIRRLPSSVKGRPGVFELWLPTIGNGYPGQRTASIP